MEKNYAVYNIATKQLEMVMRGMPEFAELQVAGNSDLMLLDYLSEFDNFTAIKTHQVEVNLEDKTACLKPS